MLGCSKDDESSNGSLSPSNSSLYGTWQFQSVEIGGRPYHLNQVLPWAVGTKDARIVINKNGTCVYSNIDSSGVVLSEVQGYFSVDKSKCVVNVNTNSGSLMFRGKWEVRGDILKLIYSQGHEIELVAKRQ